jgi:chromosome partitioning protein
LTAKQWVKPKITGRAQMTESDKKYFTSTEIQHLFLMNDGAPQTLISAERSGHIPVAERQKRGKIDVRKWAIEQIPAIGSKYGFLKKPSEPKVVCIYTAKGGVLKSTISYCLSRILALNGVRVLVIGLDIQGTITDLALHPVAIETLDQLQSYQGVADIVLKGVDPFETIHQTDLPTLDIIPETPGLGPLEKHIRDSKRREFVLSERVISRVIKDYDVVIIDNSPNWNLLIENALTAANVVISPIGCDLGSYQALETNISTTLEFQREMKLRWDSFILIPTLHEKNKLSSQIYGAYLNQYPDLVVHTPIRRAVAGPEALTLRQSAIEYNPKSDLARDYYDVSREIWKRICGDGSWR